MKKVLSGVLVASLALSSFASIAFGAELTAQEKFDALKEKGIFAGYVDGSAGLDKTMTRAEVSKVLVKLLGLTEDASAASYSDLDGATWAVGFIGAASKAGIMNGVGGGKFDPSGTFTTEQLAAVLARALDLPASTDAVAGNVDEWAKGYVAAAIKAGLLTTADDYTAPALRELLVAATYAADAVVNPVTEVAVDKVEQTNVREITVTFNKEVPVDKKAGLTYEVKNGLVSYTVTATWAADNKSVVLASNYLPAADYDVTVKGFETKKVTVVDEKSAKIDITATALQKANDQDLGVKLLNQFGKEIASPTLTTSVYNATQPVTIAADGNGKYDLLADAVAKVDDTIVVTVTHASGISATKTFKVVAGSAAKTITLGTVAPLKDKVRISAGETGLVLPYELVDQYGNKITLPQTAEVTLGAGVSTFTVNGITFMLSEADVLTKYTIDDKGVLTFTVSKAASLVINAVNPATGATGTTTVKVEGAPVLKTLQLNNPGSLVVANEEFKVPFAAVDTFGGTVAAKDIVIDQNASPAANALKFNTNIAFAAGYPKINGKGELLFKFATQANDATAYIYAYVNGGQVGQLQLAVKKDATAVKINGIKDVATKLANNATVEFDKDNVTYLDSYNRTSNVAGLPIADVTIVSGDSVTLTNDGTNITGIQADAAKTGVTKIAVTLGGVAATKYEFEVEVVKAEDIKSYAIKTIGTIYGVAGQDQTSTHAKTVELVGKTAAGAEVALVQASAFDFVTTSDATKIGVNGIAIFGLDEGTATIAAYKGATKLAEQAVTVSKAAPIAAKVSFAATEYNVADAATLTFTTNAGTTLKISVVDQYGVDITPAGFLASSDAAIASVAGLVVTGQAPGQVTLTYITANNVSATTVLVVN